MLNVGGLSSIRDQPGETGVTGKRPGCQRVGSRLDEALGSYLRAAKARPHRQVKVAQAAIGMTVTFLLPPPRRD
jgi:hypothetical protein